MTHELKILPEWYNSVISGNKRFEVRKDDRTPKYSALDKLLLREFDGEKYTGRTATVQVTLVLRGEYCKEGYCIMSVNLIDYYPQTPPSVHIEKSRDDLRQCTVHDKKAYFHKWADISYIVPPSLMVGGHNGGQVSNTLGIIEYEDGTVAEVEPTSIKFEV